MGTTPPPHRKQHKPSSSLGSLYEVLADLDETQLHYLIQEMNHTGDQHVPVSQAVSAFESQNPSDSLNNVRASMMPAPNGLQRTLSKSQQGKLRLQTAFRREPSLRQRRLQENHRAAHPAEPVHVVAPETPKRPAPSDYTGTPEPLSPPAQVSSIHEEPPRALTQPRKDETIPDPVVSQTLSDQPRKPPAYRRIPRLTFSLPPGVTVTDLLQLLETEFLSSSLDDPPSPGSFSSPSPLLLSTPSPKPLPRTPGSGGAHTLRKYSSRLDMALEAERSASSTEEIGLGMLEPRPVKTASMRTSATTTPISFEDSFDCGFSGQTPPAQPMVLEGIFDVLNNQ
ncbi:hypothetical protein JX266_006975 [Neoarthrinium moseri]|nr:hypothetical protein JX266_006975 [Neoarthrinium moseri]